jgi:hypothetical protein
MFMTTAMARRSAGKTEKSRTLVICAVVAEEIAASVIAGIG